MPTAAFEPRLARLQRAQDALGALERLPRLGWADAPTPIDPLPDLAAALGLPWLGCKRDDQTWPLLGGSKTRKLDYLLAASPWAEAPRWATAGAIGSGHLVACVAAAQALGRQVDAHLFWEPLSAGVLDNLAYTATGAARLAWHGSRLGLAAGAPAVLLGRHSKAAATIPPGGTLPVAMLGLVRGGLELAIQVHQGQLPEPERLYLALGSGGTAVGLALGLGLGGLDTRVYAVAAVERLFATRGRLRRLDAGLRRHLAAAQLPELAKAMAAPILTDFKHVGRGYGHVSPASLAAVAQLQAAGIGLEPVYTGKAMAGLLDDARRLQADAAPRGPVLFWSTVRRLGPLPHAADFRSRLPAGLARRLQHEEATPDSADPHAQDQRARRTTRRRFLVGGLALATGAAVVARLTGYDVPDWQGRVLSASEATILAACAEALLQPAPQAVACAAPVDCANPALAWIPVAERVDAYLAAMPSGLRRQVRVLLQTLEQLPLALDGNPTRLSRQPPPERLAFLLGVQRRGQVDAAATQPTRVQAQMSEVWDGIRELCMAGYYSQPAAWPSIGYPGPWVAPKPRPRRAQYAALVAPAGTRPRSAPR